jgi:hypothetical protein
MKKYIFTLFLILAATGISVRAHGQAPDYLGLPGDNLNLFAVMKLFQESKTLEIFERDLNNEDMRINNLDLDQDGRIDYIRVVDHADGNYHSIVLQDALSPRDIQDIAVFTVYRDHQGRVSIQLTGDEALYGRDYIVEPNYADLDYNETPNPGYTEYNRETVVINRTTTLEVAAWPVIRFIFLPTYVVWQSPWYYNYYPTYWRPWRPYYWHYYYGYHYNWDPYYYGHYRVYSYHRDPYWHNTYYSQRRHYSPVVTTRIESGSYKRTYSHPEARKAGYDNYYKRHPEQSARRSAQAIPDPVARKSTNQGSTGTAGRRTLGDSHIRNQNDARIKSTTGTRTTGTRTTETRTTGTRTTETRTNGTRTTGSGQTDTRRGSGETVQPDTRTRTNQTVQPETRTRSTGTSTDTRVSNTNQKPRTFGDRNQTQTRTNSQQSTETHRSERRSSGANTGTSGATKKPAEKKAAESTTNQGKSGARR